jgi:hypothetical protein
MSKRIKVRPVYVSHPSHDFSADVCARCGVRLDGRVASRPECEPVTQPAPAPLTREETGPS